jgi:hypothetical protein
MQHYVIKFASDLQQVIIKATVMVMMFNATFNNISATSWRSVLLEEETGETPRETTDLLQVTGKLYHIWT